MEINAMTRLWESIKQEFEPEGALRDVYISNTTLRDWEDVLAHLRESNYHLTFFRDGEQAELPLTASAIFEISEKEHCFITTDIGDNCLNCHFFGYVEEIEFDFDPRDIHDFLSFCRLLDFVKHLAKAVNKPIGISMENYREETFLKFVPQTNKLIYQVNNEEQEIEV
jgi:hypothetical protein